jgi:AraC-like DNA-binding protein
MDALSDVLKSVRLEGAVYINAEFTAPWCVQAKFGIARIRAKLARADHVVFFHYLAEGSCKMSLADGSEVLEAVAGDLILFPQDEHHLLGSDLQLAPVATSSLVDPEEDPETDLLQMRHGGGGVATRFVCGYLACSRSMCRLLFDALPRMIRIPTGDGPASMLMRELLGVGVRESATSNPGAESMLAKLSELMFVEAMRTYVASLPPGGKGWLAGVHDTQVGRALTLLHGQPARDWSVDELAVEAGISRSALAQRFSEVIGQPPMQYLTRWRLSLAAEQLRHSGRAIGTIAEESGYESEAAFNRAFKREFGVPPASWRRDRRSAAAA